MESSSSHKFLNITHPESIYNVQCTMFNVQCAMLNIQCAMFSRFSFKLNAASFFILIIAGKTRTTTIVHCTLSVHCTLKKAPLYLANKTKSTMGRNCAVPPNSTVNPVLVLLNAKQRIPLLENRSRYRLVERIHEYNG